MLLILIFLFLLCIIMYSMLYISSQCSRIEEKEEIKYQLENLEQDIYYYDKFDNGI